MKLVPYVVAATKDNNIVLESIEIRKNWEKEFDQVFIKPIFDNKVGVLSKLSASACRSSVHSSFSTFLFDNRSVVMYAWTV